MNTTISYDKHGWRLALAGVLAALWLTACGGGDPVSAPTALTFSPAPAQAVAQLPAAVGQTQTGAPALAAAPSTGEFKVNTTAGSSQSNPVIARLQNGNHVVVWKSEQTTPTAGAPEGVQGVCTQRYGADGKALGTQACLASDVALSSAPAVAALADGGYLLAWAKPENNSYGSNANIWAQRFDGNGTAIASVQQINSVTRFGASLSAAGLADGGYVVAWTSSKSTLNASANIFARRFGADGVPCPCGVERQGNTFSGLPADGASQSESVVAALKDGGYVVIWVSTNQNGFQGGAVYAQRYGRDHNGGPVGPETLLTRNPPLGQGARTPAVASQANGGYVLAYQLSAPIPQPQVYLSRVVVQPFAADGAALAAQSTVDPLVPGEPVRICTSSRVAPNTPCPPFQSSPAVAALDDGSFVVAWTSDKSTINYNESYVRRYSGEGAPLGAPTRFTTLSANPALSPTSGGGFIVAFEALDPNRPPAFPRTVGINARYFDGKAFRDDAGP